MKKVHLDPSHSHLRSSAARPRIEIASAALRCPRILHGFTRSPPYSFSPFLSSLPSSSSPPPSPSPIALFSPPRGPHRWVFPRLSVIWFMDLMLLFYCSGSSRGWDRRRRSGVSRGSLSGSRVIGGRIGLWLVSKCWGVRVWRLFFSLFCLIFLNARWLVLFAEGCKLVVFCLKCCSSAAQDQWIHPGWLLRWPQSDETWCESFVLC